MAARCATEAFSTTCAVYKCTGRIVRVGRLTVVAQW